MPKVYFETISLPNSKKLVHGIRACLLLWVILLEYKSLIGLKKSTHKYAITLLNDISNATSGSGLNLGSKIINFLRRKQTKNFDLHFSKSKLVFPSGKICSEAEYFQILEQLNKDGFVKVNNFLSSLQTNDIYRKILEIPTHSDNGIECRNLRTWLESENNEPRAWTNDKELVKLNDLNSIVQNFFVLKLSRDFFGSSPLIGAVQSWTTKSVSLINELELANSALAFHSDADYFKFVKFFILLTDVNENNGPFTFVKSSHRGSRHVAGRVRDIHIPNLSERRLLGTGKAGDLVVADTSGWHKGTPVITGSRTMVQLLFTSSLFGHPTV